jgi:hypothetical protein
MGHIKDFLYLILDLLGLGAATMQVASGLDDLLKSQEQVVHDSGLTNTHEEFLFWFNIVKVSVIFVVVVGYYAMRAYVYWKNHVKEKKAPKE